MNKLIDRQTFVISVNLDTLTGAIPSQVQLPMNLRFAVEGMILKSIVHNNSGAVADVDYVVQI